MWEVYLFSSHWTGNPLYGCQAPACLTSGSMCWIISYEIAVWSWIDHEVCLLNMYQVGTGVCVCVMSVRCFSLLEAGVLGLVQPWSLQVVAQQQDLETSHLSSQSSSNLNKQQWQTVLTSIVFTLYWSGHFGMHPLRTIVGSWSMRVIHLHADPTQIHQRNACVWIRSNPWAQRARGFYFLSIQALFDLEQGLFDSTLRKAWTYYVNPGTQNNGPWCRSILFLLKEEIPNHRDLLLLDYTRRQSIALFVDTFVYLVLAFLLIFWFILLVDNQLTCRHPFQRIWVSFWIGVDRHSL